MFVVHRKGGTDARLEIKSAGVIHANLAHRVVGRAAEPVKIRAGWIGAPASIIPFMFMKEGLAKHNGASYVLEPTYFAGSPLEIAAIAAGELEIATLGYSTFSIAVLNAGLKDLKIVADEISDGVGNYFSLTYAVRKDLDIQKIADLKDKVVATNAIGAGAYIPLDVMLRRNQLLPNRDYRVIETQFPNMKAMLMESKVALITSTTPFVYDPELQAVMRPLFRAKDAMGVTALSFWAMRAGFIEKIERRSSICWRITCGRHAGSSTRQTEVRQ